MEQCKIKVIERFRIAQGQSAGVEQRRNDAFLFFLFQMTEYLKHCLQLLITQILISSELRHLLFIKIHIQVIRSDPDLSEDRLIHSTGPPQS